MKPSADGLPPAPPVATGLFPPERVPVVVRYAELLATDGVTRGLVGPREVARLWERHLLNCALLARLLPRGARVADVGSGAGLPGVVLALARPDVTITLVEPLLRRTTFLEEVVADLGLPTVEVRRDRADALHGKQTFDVVTARAVAPLDRLLGWCMPLVAADGELIAMKGSAAEDEIDAAEATLRRLGCAPPRVEDLEAEDVPQTRVVRVTWADPARVSWRTSAARARPQGRRRGGRKRGEGFDARTSRDD